MARALLIAVRFHEGRYHGAGDWPPAPGRLFQALVAAAAQGARLEEVDAEALAWLERLDRPEIAAPPARAGQAMATWVPNNDLDTVGGDPARAPEIKAAKAARPMLFDAAVPILYRWRFEDGPAEAARICAIADRLYQLGRGVDMAWATGEVLAAEDADTALAAHPGALRAPGGPGDVAVPTEGTLGSLVARHEGFRRRFSAVGSGRAARWVFAQPPKPLLRRVGYDAAPRRLLFDFRRGDAFAPCPLVSAAPLVAALRDAAAARLADALPDRAAEVERLLAGRGAEAADKARRVRLIPLPSIGHAEADSSIRRFAVELPPDCPLRADDVAWAFTGLALPASETGESPRRGLSAPMTSAWRDAIAPPPVAGGPSLPPRCRAPRGAGSTLMRVRPSPVANVWTRKSGRLAPCAGRCAMRASRPRPSTSACSASRSTAAGTRAEAFAEGTRFVKHALWHVELGFAEPVPGPLALGDGRFGGLGLMAPEHEATGLFAFRIAGAGPLPRGPDLAAALRRAVMARARDSIGSTVLDAFFTGHGADGAPLRGGGRAHIACLADPPRRRLLVIAPHRLDRRAPEAGERRHLRALARALAGFDRLHLAGGKALKLAAAQPASRTTASNG